MKRINTYEKIPHRENHINIKEFCDFYGAKIHWHEIIEILYYADSGAVVTYNLNEHNAQAGDILFVNGNELHSVIQSHTPATYYCIHFRTDFFSNFINGKYVVFQNVIRDKDCASCLDKMIKYSRSAEFDKEIKMKRYAYEFIDLIMERYVKNVVDAEEYKKQFKIYDKFNEIVIYINSHYDENLTVAQLSERFFLSESYFSYFFKANSGMSVMRYVNEVRIKHAKEYLDRDSMSVGQVANLVGFDDINYFSRKFKKLVGVTPSQYRKKPPKIT